MADMNRITLASRDVTRSGCTLNVWMKLGSLAAIGQPPAYRSFPPCLSPQGQRSGYETGLRQDHAGKADVDCAVVRAGRSWGWTGFLCQGFALPAGPAIPLGWPVVTGGPSSSAVVAPCQLLAGYTTPAGNCLPRLTSPGGTSRRQTATSLQTLKPAQDRWTRRMPAGKAMATVIRGARS